MGDSKAISCAQSASLKEQAFEQAHLEPFSLFSESYGINMYPISVSIHISFVIIEEPYIKK